MSRTFNGEPAAAPMRKQAYRDEYRKLQPTGVVLAIPCPSGGEVHYEDGSRGVVRPGDWVAEGSDGRLRIVPAAVIATEYEPLDGAKLVHREAAKRVSVPELRDERAVVPVKGSLLDNPDTGYHADREIGREGDEAFDEAGPARIAEQSEAAQKAADEAAERAQARARLQAEARAMQDRIIELAGLAFGQELITEHEQHAWINQGELPPGLVIEPNPDGEGHIMRREPAGSALTPEQLAAQAEAADEAAQIAALGAQQAAEESAATA